MAAPQERYITDPAQLQEFLADNRYNSGETTQHAAPRLRLALLQPLVDPAMFAACRNLASKTIRHSNGRLGDVISLEYLDISALDKAWRHALATLPPTSHITFDLSLPKPVDDSEAPKKIYWDTVTPPTGQHVAILARNVMRLVASIATATRMRVQGEVHFGLSYDEAEGVSTRGMDRLSKQLKNIVKAKGTLQTGTVDIVKKDAYTQSTDENPAWSR
ncbi:hypothetical protein VTI74DRAFT_7157 [Chaetomium olivicolor]